MAVQYTYKDFEEAAKNAGLLGQFSQADLQTAQSNPNFGMSILGLKQNWANAATDEEKQQINDQANQLRSSYGNYTGGADGSQYISTGLLNNKVDDQLSKLENYAPFSYDVSAPTYTNQYAAQQQALLNEIMNREAFDWSKETDPLWPVYKKEYLREGDRATQDALGAAATLSGGIPSSYALTAATQAGDYYATKLNDVLPTLRAQAYDEYLNEYNRQLSALSALNTQEQSEYSKYLNELSQYNTDRNFAYNDYQTQYNMLQSYLANLQGQQQTEFSQRQQVQQYQDALAQYQNSLKQQEFENALNAAQVFGYLPENWADALGIPAGTLTADQAYNEWYMNNQAAKAAVGSGGSSGGSSGSGSSGGNSSGADWDGLFAAAMQSGHPQSFIANNYKNYGFTSSSGLWSDYQDWEANGGGNSGGGVTTDQNSSDYWNVVNELSRIESAGVNVNSKAVRTIQKANESGKITDAQAKTLLSQYGF